MRERYVKRPDQTVVAVQLNLDVHGFRYEKWGDTQTCKRGDWIVDNGGDVYTVDRESFAQTYRAAGRGVYLKTTPVWAERATRAGSVKTKEGSTSVRPGDYLVFNDADGTDAYAMSPSKFEAMYEPAPA